MRLAIISVIISMLLSLAFWNLPSLGGEQVSRELIERVAPAVVTVICYNKTGHPFKQGSGFLFRAEAHLITNYHVLGDVEMAKIRTRDGKEFNVKAIVGEDKASDLIEAVVDMPAGAVRSLPLTRIAPKPGDHIMVVGSPMGVEQAVSLGDVIDIREVPGHGNVIRYNAHSYHGSSGSPVVNMDGEVVGVVSFGIPPSICYAIPVERMSGLARLWKTLLTPNTQQVVRDKADADEMLERLKQLADGGDLEAQMKLAMMYEEGREVGRDCSKALDLSRRGAERNFLPAEYQLGRLYYEGRCISQNYGEAVKWFQKAAERGFPDAQRALGTMLYNGDGVPCDKVQACKWMILASSQGNQAAQKTLRLFSAELTRDQLKQAQEMAQNWRPGR